MKWWKRFCKRKLFDPKTATGTDMAMWATYANLGYMHVYWDRLRIQRVAWMDRPLESKEVRVWWDDKLVFEWSMFGGTATQKPGIWCLRLYRIYLLARRTWDKEHFSPLEET
jgi:hypothetical protein